MAGGKFEGGVSNVEKGIRDAARRARDLASNIDKAQQSWGNFGKKTEQIQGQIKDLTKSLDEAKSKSIFEGGSFEEDIKKVKDLTSEIDRLNKKVGRIELLSKSVNTLTNAFDKFGKSLANLHKTIFSAGLEFLADGIKRVYDLQERWTKAIGAFNMRLGGLTTGLRGAQKAASQWDSTMRGLTDGAIGEGMQMFAEFTTSMSRVVEAGDGAVKFGIQLARGFSLGGDAAGRLVRSFESIEMTAGQGAVVMADMTSAANAMHVPVNLVAKDISEANDYLVRFGKTGAKQFVTAAAFARKFGMSMNDLRKSVERFDMMEEATTTVAKFNVAFGTAINGIDVMLEDDPAKRMDVFRQSLLQQGKTYDTLSPKMRRLAADMLQVNDTQLAAMLSTKNANTSYTKVLEKQQATEQKEAKAKRDMELGLRKTAQTMFAFGAAFDRITVAIGKAIRPLLEALGLAKKNSPEWKSFGQVMEGVTSTIVGFFEDLASNPKWIGFMGELARDLIKVGGALKDFVTGGGAVALVGKIVTVTQELYQAGKSAFQTMFEWGKKLMPVIEFIFAHSKGILATWAGFKVASGAFNAVSGAANTLGNAFGGAEKIGSVGTRLAGAGVGAGIGAMTGGGTAGAVGGALGGALGSLAGPIGTAVGSALGGWLARKGVDWLFPKQLTKEQAFAIRIEKEMNKISKEKNLVQEKLATEQALRDARQREADAAALEAVKGNRRETERLIAKQQEYWSTIEDLRTQAEKEYQDKVKAFETKQQQDVTELLIRSKKVELEDAQIKNAELAKQNGTTILSDEERKILAKGAATGGGIDPAERARYLAVKKKSEEFFNMKTAEIAREKRIQKELAILEAKKLQQQRDFMKADAGFAAEKSIMTSRAEDFIKFRQEHLLLSNEEAKRQFFQSLDQSDPAVRLALEGMAASEAMSRTITNQGQGPLVSEGFASGGIVRSPTRALLGEAGPEAVIPLRSMARGKGFMPNKFGGNAAKRLVNYAAQGQTGTTSNNVVVVAGDVYLDGNKVGRHLVRNAISGR